MWLLLIKMDAYIHGAYFLWVPMFVWVLINSIVVVVIKMGAYIHGVLIFHGCLVSRFYSRTGTVLYNLCS